MVFFTSLIICLIIYYLRTDGLIYITIIAVAGELINIFMSQTMAKTAEQKTGQKYSKIIDKYKIKLKAQKKKIQELEKIQEDSIQKVYTANKKIKEYEQRLGANAEQKPDVKKEADPQPPSSEAQEPDDTPTNSRPDELGF